MGIDPAPDDLVRADLIDQVRFTPYAEYAFRHPVIRSVAYESQLKSARAQLHRRLAAAIESRDPASADENAPLIAEHFEAAGDLHDAYRWHMRAGGWSTIRDIAASRVSWERAVQVADALPPEDADRLAMRIAPRTMLIGNSWRGTPAYASGKFEELRELCAEADDKTSLAIAMTGLESEHWQYGRMKLAYEQAVEQMALVESIGDPALTAATTFAAICIRQQNGEMNDALRWAQTTIDWAAGDSARGVFGIATPLAMALAFRGTARWWLGRRGWREDLDEALAIARNGDPSTVGFITAWVYGNSVLDGVLWVDDTALRDFERALEIAEASGDDNVFGSIATSFGSSLTIRGSAGDRERRLGMLALVRDMCLNLRFPQSELPTINLFIAYEQAADGDAGAALPQMRKSVDDLFDNRQYLYAIGCTALLVETLLNRAAEGDLAEAEAAVERLATIPGDGWVARDIMVLRLRTLLAKFRGDEARYRELLNRYRAQATSLGFAGHIQWAESMP